MSRPARAGWFVRTAWRLSFGGSGDGGGRILGFLAAACAAVLAAFMIKGLFFIRRGKPEGLTELTPAEQPRLFKFLHQLADEAGAPRPHKVYASARVNAAVFYDLSLLNLLLPSRKNLEIGLSLVNSLTLGETRGARARVRPFRAAHHGRRPLGLHRAPDHRAAGGTGATSSTASSTACRAWACASRGSAGSCRPSRGPSAH